MGNVQVVGIGPGSYEDMTIRAVNVLTACDVIAGYSIYVELLRPHFPEKEFLTTPMRKERERCVAALAQAKLGKNVALVCSGDAGVYGLAGLLLECARDYPEVEIGIVPGVTAALSAAALLGAPLVNDFCAISLSDLLTPWEDIERRFQAAAEGDFVIVLYNPSSQRRREHLKNACRLLLRYKSPETVCGIARQIGREGEAQQVLTLKELTETGTDMFTTVIIGNSRTRIVSGRMVTPRGYLHEEDSSLRGNNGRT